MPFTWREAGENEPEYSHRVTLLNLPGALKGSHFLQTHKDTEAQRGLRNLLKVAQLVNVETDSV